MTIFNFHVAFRKRINISVTVVSQSYVLLYYEQKVYMLFINKICLDKKQICHHFAPDVFVIQKFLNNVLLL